jgi:hypothetical protein
MIERRHKMDDFTMNFLNDFKAEIKLDINEMRKDIKTTCDNFTAIDKDYSLHKKDNENDIGQIKKDIVRIEGKPTHILKSLTLGGTAILTTAGVVGIVVGGIMILHNAGIIK